MRLKDRWIELAEAFLAGRGNVRNATEYCLRAIDEMTTGRFASQPAAEGLRRELVQVIEILVHPEKIFKAAYTVLRLRTSAYGLRPRARTR